MKLIKYIKRKIWPIEYHTNFMGPVRTDFNNGVGKWAGGRIDVWGTKNYFSPEIGLPIMKLKDFNIFSLWLQRVNTRKVLTLKQLLKRYYKDGYGRITWYNYDEKL